MLDIVVYIIFFYLILRVWTASLLRCCLYMRASIKEADIMLGGGVDDGKNHTNDDYLIDELTTEDFFEL